MLPILVLVFLAVPFAELAVIIWVGAQIGVFETIGLLVAVSVVGAWLSKREGLGVVRAIQMRLDRGEMPGQELVDGALILFAGALLLTPGFLTDLLAISLLMPPVRAGVRGLLRKRFARRVQIRRWE